MLEKRTPISVTEALKKITVLSGKGKLEQIPLEEAYGRFLGENLIATHDVPFFDRSPYDGFAVIAADTAAASRENPVTLQVVGEIGAGSVHETEVISGQAVRIMTGAQLPSGCNAVVMLELAESKGNFVTIKRPYKAGDNISFTGEDTKKGTILAKKGAFITPGIMALLATFGYRTVKVSQKPIVGIIATGSELLEVDEPLQAGKIRNSNAYMLLAQIEQAGGSPIYFGQCKDDFDTCYEQVKSALDSVDFLITTGGVSVGDYDYLPAIYQKLGANVLFNKIAMRPGSVTTVAEYNGKLLFGLSGNPSACFVGFELFVYPLIRIFLHNDQPYHRKETAILGSDFIKPNPFTRFVRAIIFYEDGELIVYPSGLDQSNAVSSLAHANALIILPGGTRSYHKGRAVDILLLNDPQGNLTF